MDVHYREFPAGFPPPSFVTERPQPSEGFCGSGRLRCEIRYWYPAVSVDTAGWGGVKCLLVICFTAVVRKEQLFLGLGMPGVVSLGRDRDCSSSAMEDLPPGLSQ